MEEEIKRLKKQLSMAVSLKYYLMPDRYPAFPDIPEIDIYADQINLAKVGGDFFDYFMIDTGHIGIVVADIFDGGEAAALYMTALKIYLKRTAGLGLSPAETMGTVNSLLARENLNDLCLSAWFGVYDLNTGIVTAVDAGHESPIVQTKNGMVTFGKETKSYLLGVVEGVTYESYEIALEPGDRILLMTDGVLKARNKDGKAYSRERITELMNEDPLGSAEDLVGAVQADLFEHIGEEPLKDDATLMVVRRCG